MLNQEPRPPLMIKDVKLVLTVNTTDGRAHELEIVQAGDNFAPVVNYVGNNVLLDKQLATLLKALNQTNGGLI